MITAQIHQVITDNCTNQNAWQNAKDLVEAVPDWADNVRTEQLANAVDTSLSLPRVILDARVAKGAPNLAVLAVLGAG